MRIFNGKQDKHTGIDIANENKENIICVYSGVVVFAGSQNGYGNCIEIKHTDNSGKEFYTFYAHMNRLDVDKNQEVVQGQILGIEGGKPRSR